LQICIAEFIALFVFSVVCAEFLNSVVGQMNVLVFASFKVKLGRRCPYVALLVPVGLNAAIDAAYKHVVSNVKLSFIVK